MFINIQSGLRLRCMRQYELARRAGVSESFMSLVISGRREADSALREKIAEILQCDESWLFRRVQKLPAHSSQEESAQSSREATTTT
jgi:transcriptional regulator with XRE-family HTH domain